MTVATCPKCQKQFKSEGHLAQHMATHMPKVVQGDGQVVRPPAPVHPEDAVKPRWARFEPAPAPPAPGTVPQGGGVLVTSGIWEMGVALENEFLERHKAKITPEQSKAMDTNLAAYMGQAGKPISPSMGLIFGIFSIYIVPVVMEAAPYIKVQLRAGWDKWEAQQKDRKEKAGAKDDDRRKLPAAGQ